MRAIHRPAEAAGSAPRGIGLSIVGTLAAGQGIPITCRSEIGKGTSIALLIPCGDTGSSAAPAATTATAVRGGNER
jgi:hypothetical protein